MADGERSPLNYISQDSLEGGPLAPPDGTEDITVLVESDDPDGEPTIDKKTGALLIPTADGGLKIDFRGPQKPDEGPGNFNDNLAEKIDDTERRRIGSDLVEKINTDDQSRSEWLENRAKGIEMLGFALEESRGDTGTSSAPIEGMSTVRHTALAEACIRFQANASAELLPAGGPVKVQNYGGETDQADDLAEALERDFNYYLTNIDKGYRPDTVRALFSTGFGGVSFKKVYFDPIRRMPVSRTVDAADLIVSNDVSDLEDAGRITHRIIMRPSVLRRMQLAGAYRDVSITMPTFQPNAVESREAEVQGIQLDIQRPEDQPYTIYECYCELDLPGYEHKGEDGEKTGLPLPYRVVVDKDSYQVLEIRRNWNENDPLCLPKRVFVKYPFVAAFGFYEIGLLQILGNAQKALTGAWRLALDNAMFACFPGFLYADVAGRQLTNEFRIPPGGGQKINTGGQPIGEVIMPLPYTSTHMPALATVIQGIQTEAQRIGGTAEFPVSEGRQEAPVGTTLALIEQATKVLAAVHIGLHAAQAEEFQLLKELFREDPSALWRGNRAPRCPWAEAYRVQDQAHRDEAKQKFIEALERYDLVPQADPNIPSHMHRVMKAVAIKQLQAMNPALYDGQAVDARIMKMIGVSDPFTLFNQAPPAPPPESMPPPPDVAKLAAIQQKEQSEQREAQLRAQEAQANAAEVQQTGALRLKEISTEADSRALDRESRESVARERDHTARTKIIGELIREGLVDPHVGLSFLAQTAPAKPQAIQPTPQRWI